MGFRCRLGDPNLYINPYLNTEQNTNQVNHPEDFDICWYDLAITPDILYRIKCYQRLSQYPGIQVIAHKNKLAKNLMMMRREFGEEYNFFPNTYILPQEVQELK